MGNAMGPEEKSSGPGLEALGRLQAHQQAWQECGHKSYRTQMICQLEHVSEQMDEVRRLLKCEPMSHGSVEVQLAEVQRLKKEHKLDLLLRERKLKKEQQAQKREEKKKERKAAPKAKCAPTAKRAAKQPKKTELADDVYATPESLQQVNGISSTPDSS